MDQIKQIVGEPLIDLLLVEGGTLVLYLGEKTSVKPLRTWIRLWIDCAWRLRQAAHPIVGSFNDAEEAMSSLRDLRGQKVTEASLIHPWNDLKVEFEGQFYLETFAYSTIDEAWELRRADGYRFGCSYPDGIYERNDERDSRLLRGVKADKD